ncbi:MAG: hypothetical protein DI536_31595 [Archangium gephyra]|uniref:Uncharacterized protein n=1 Tax=Archangium gephyra TaxID=48 RepID=A0A2W5T1J5_9BACT|nr:MAG: hypothetical protein DI536_31595 [Archangium gephyra]
MPTSTRGRDPAREEEFLGALYKGGELLASGNVIEAREHLEKAHGLEPKNEKAQNLLGLTYFKLGLYDQASEVYEKLVNENPTDATLRVNLGLVYLKTNALERCIHEFETATDLEPTHKKAHNYLGLALAQQGSYVKARDHFELAGSDQMAEKMARAIAAQSTPSGQHGAVAKQAPKTVVLGAEEERPAPPVAAVPEPHDDTIEVMSDEELPSDVYVVPEDVAAAAPPPEAANLNGDWGAQFDGGEGASPVEEMRFAEDEGPSSSEELPVLEAEVEVVDTAAAELPAPMPSTPTPAWLTMEAAEASRVDSQTEWVTESVADVPPPGTESVPAEVVEGIAAGVSSEEVPVSQGWEQSYADASGEHEPAAMVEPLPSTPDDWASAHVPVEPIAQTVEPLPTEPDDSSWATAQAVAAPLPEVQSGVQAAADDSWASAPVEVVETPAVAASDSSWGTTPADVVEPAASTPDESSWATAPVDVVEPAANTPDDSSWATAPVDVVEPAANAPDESSWASDAESAPVGEPLATTPDDASWATAPVAEPLATTPDDASWATSPAAQQETPITDDALLGNQSADAAWGAPSDTQWATEQIQGVPTPLPQPDPTMEAAPPIESMPEPSAPLPITVEEPAAAPEYVAAPAGYTPMAPQRLVDLGAAGAWVHDASSGPFHLSSDGLAVTISGEMLLRTHGLVAVVGSVQVAPEQRRRRGRSTQEPFGSGNEQLQRVTGHGIIYLEPGRAKFHAVDLTDHNGVKVDDDGAYIREEYVFAFEEPISFENGRLTSDAQIIELVHLKGTGRVLLQLDGSLRAMPIPVAAPLVVPLHRVVGWFGRVTPRITGFGGRSALELTGEGYALLGAPPERS